MTADSAVEPLDRGTALGICQQVQAEVRGKPWSAGWWQCWGCRRFSRGDAEKMCIAAKPGYRGCELVNRWLERVPRRSPDRVPDQRLPPDCPERP